MEKGISNDELFNLRQFKPKAAIPPCQQWNCQDTTGSVIGRVQLLEQWVEANLCPETKKNSLTRNQSINHRVFCVISPGSITTALLDREVSAFLPEETDTYIPTYSTQRDIFHQTAHTPCIILRHLHCHYRVAAKHMKRRACRWIRHRSLCFLVSINFRLDFGCRCLVSRSRQFDFIILWQGNNCLQDVGFGRACFLCRICWGGVSCLQRQRRHSFTTDFVSFFHNPEGFYERCHGPIALFYQLPCLGISFQLSLNYIVVRTVGKKWPSQDRLRLTFQVI